MGFGLFHVTEVTGKKQKTISSHTLQSLGCDNCPLDREKLRHPKMPATGAERPEFYFIGEAPGEIEDQRGEQFVGSSGQLIRGSIPSRWAKRIRWNNVINCRPPDNRTPTEYEIACCRKRLIADIELSKPPIVVGFGAIPLQWFVGTSAIKLWSGRKVACAMGKHRFWYYPMLHPSFILRQGGSNTPWHRLFDKQLKRVFTDAEQAGVAPEVVSVSEAHDGIESLLGVSADRVIRAIRKYARNHSDYSLDWETTGLRPYPKDSKILTASLGTWEDTIAFPIMHPEAGYSPSDQERILDTLREVLPEAKAVYAHHARFEEEWSLHFLGESVSRSIQWRCTLAQAYTLDERKGLGELDDLTRIYLGIRIKELSDVDKKNMVNEPLEKILPYNGMDTKFTHRIAKIQNLLIRKQGLVESSRMNQRRTFTMAITQYQGIVPNTKVAKELQQEFESSLEETHRRISRLKDVRTFEATYGKFLPSSNKDMRTMFEKHLKRREGFRGLGKYSTDEAVLSAVRHPLAPLILESRALNKMLGTYLRPITSGRIVSPDGRIHTTYSNLVASTGRTASSDPVNLQNFPKRKHKEVRGVLGCPPGHWMCAFDQGQIEARVIGMLSNDKTLCAALWEGYDIHQEWAERIAHAYPQRIGGIRFIKDKEVMKLFRNDVKNEWTFPLFFGAQMDSAAGYLNIPIHKIEPLYEEFWNQFAGVKVWQDKLIEAYNINFYVETPTNRRRRWGKANDPMNINEIINSPVQGTASDIVVDGQERIIDAAWERQEPWQVPVMNIHDDLTFYFPDKVMEEACEFTGKTLCLSPYAFVNVPLTVELSVGKDGAHLEDIHKFSSTDYGVRK